jgi:hypothetical protein
MIAETIPGLSSLSADQKILLAAELWRDAVGGIGQEPNAALVEAYRKRPDEVSCWEEVRSRLQTRKN